MAYRNHPVRDTFDHRHLGNSADKIQEMLAQLGVKSIDELIEQTIPNTIRAQQDLELPQALTEFEYLNLIRDKANKNQLCRSYIGMGYYGTIMPAVIRRNIFENPGWYTQYTPYQAEIAQGRLEALLNFQTMVSDLTGLPIANASLLDESTAAAEAMNMFFGQKNKRKVMSPKFFVDQSVFPQTLAVLATRALPLGIEIVVGDYHHAELDDSYFGVLVQYPNAEGSIEDYRALVKQAHTHKAYVTVVADLLSLTLLTPPAEWGADAVVGTTQRFGVPIGFGGPHAAYFATHDQYKRDIPGRIIGVSVDRHGQPALRMALQTREQHIRRDKATSNICTAQALLAVIAGMYAVYHGAEGLKGIASAIHGRAVDLSEQLNTMGYTVKHTQFFDTIAIENIDTQKLKGLAQSQGMNFFYANDTTVQISLDETTSLQDVMDMVAIFKQLGSSTQQHQVYDWSLVHIRQSTFMAQSIFNTYRTETELMRYIKSLENKDLSLVHSMIALGSCTMKLNAAVELEPLSWPQFANIHPFASEEQTKGYQEMIVELEQYLAVITGFDATSLQPNSGAQGEFAGLLVIKAYHQSRGDYHRNIILIPSSAHGTNPASAAMVGAKIVVVNCDGYGNIDKEDLFAKVQLHAENLAGLMITYPSTHGVYEHHIKEIIDAVHAQGGQVYMDGANMNAQVALTSPGIIGADVCHLNLHKTFAIPHGGGGPGMGPICVKKHLAPFLPSNPLVKTGGDQAISAVSAAPWGSASILLISYAYIRLLGAEGLKQATQQAILNANYIKSRLENRYDVLYAGKEFGRVAHELIVDFRGFKKSCGVEVEDVAKRLVDYGFHAPTMSFPVADTIMIEPTESESKGELDRFCDALLAIREEIDAIEKGEIALAASPLKNAPHTVAEVSANEWVQSYSRQVAAYPLAYVAQRKFWPSVGRIDNAHGDRNLICTCPSVEDYR